MATLTIARRQRDSLIDALALDEVIRRLHLFDHGDDVDALATIARNVLKRRLDEQDDALHEKSLRSAHPAFGR